MSNTPLLSLEQFQIKYCQTALLGPVDFKLLPMRWCSLLGPSGVGKSSLLRAIAGLLDPSEYECYGRIRFATELDPNPTTFMAQNDALLPWLSSLDNVLLGPRLRHQSLTQTLQQRARECMQAVGLSTAMHKLPSQLSGGMRQRVALARTLFEDKPLVLMDEPFAAVDAITRLQLYEQCRQHLKNKTVLFVTHDPMEALQLSHQIVVLTGQPAKLQSPFAKLQPTRSPLTDQEKRQHYQQLCQMLCNAQEVMS